MSATNGGNFGSLQVGTSASTLMRVYPSGAGQSSDVITDITESCANFSLTLAALPADVYKVCVGDGQVPRVAAKNTGEPEPTAICSGGYEIMDYTFGAAFSPTVSGLQSCVVTVVLQNETKTFTLTGSGTPPPREIEVSRTSISFGDVRVGSASTAQDVVVSNTGSGDLTISSARLGGASAARFTLTGGAATVAGGMSTTYRVTCQPTAVGALSATLTIDSNDDDEASISLPLTCAGVESALGVNPSPISILNARVSEPREQVVTLRNEGGINLTLASVTLSGAELELVGTPALGDIPPTGSVQVRVRYLAKTEGTSAGMLRVGFDGKTQMVNVDAQAKVASMGLHPDGTVDFGPICVGRSVVRTLTAKAVGEAPFGITGANTTGLGFAITAEQGNKSLSRDQEYVYSITATPAVAGAMSGTFSISTDIPGGGRRTVALSGSAVAAGVGVSPAELDFGSRLVNDPTTNQRFTIGNCSTGTITISDVTIEGADAADFRIAENPESSSLAISETTVFRVYMLPRTEGSKAATIVIHHSAGTTEIPVIGDGYLPPQPAADKITYYSCASGKGGAGLLLCLLLGVAITVRARRRRVAR